MKTLICFLICELLIQSTSKAAEPNRKLLKDVPVNLKKLTAETHKYKWTSVLQNGSVRELKDYGVLVTGTELTKEKGDGYDR